MRILKATAALCLGLLAHVSLAADTPGPAPKWHISVVGGATSDGQIQFRVTPHEGEAVPVNVKVNHGRPETFITMCWGSSTWFIVHSMYQRKACGKSNSNTARYRLS